MTTLFLALLVGICNGLRTFTPPAVVAWAAHLGWLKLEGTLAMVGSLPAVVVFTVLAGAELVADKMPWIPNRTSIVGLLVRIVMGKLTGMCIAVAGGQSMWLGAICGIGGAVAGTFGGYYARTRLVRALGKPDIYVALVEDLICVAASLWIVTRF
jgi:uncharacterized membrane protein